MRPATPSVMPAIESKWLRCCGRVMFISNINKPVAVITSQAIIKITSAAVKLSSALDIGNASMPAPTDVPSIISIEPKVADLPGVFCNVIPKIYYAWLVRTKCCSISSSCCAFVSGKCFAASQKYTAVNMLHTKYNPAR